MEARAASEAASEATSRRRCAWPDHAGTTMSITRVSEIMARVAVAPVPVVAFKKPQ